MKQLLSWKINIMIVTQFLPSSNEILLLEGALVQLLVAQKELLFETEGCYVKWPLGA